MVPSFNPYLHLHREQSRNSRKSKFNLQNMEFGSWFLILIQIHHTDTGVILLPTWETVLVTLWGIVLIRLNGLGYFMQITL